MELHGTDRLARLFRPGPGTAALVLAAVCLLAAGLRTGTANAAQGRLDNTESDAYLREYYLDQIRFENDGRWLKMAIPVAAPWAHWTLSDPPRIIVDLGQTTSRMPDAPGLYQVRLDRGPLAAVRTSQYRYEALDHQVRITLELARAVAYEARRVGDEIQIWIPDPVQRSPRKVLIGPNGVMETDKEDAGFPSTPASGLSVDSGRGRPSEGVKSSSPTATVQDRKVGGGIEKAVSEPDRSADSAGPARTLRQALEAVLDKESIEPLPGSKPDEPLPGSGPDEPLPRTVSDAARDASELLVRALSKADAREGAGETPVSAEKVPTDDESRQSGAGEPAHGAPSEDGGEHSDWTTVEADLPPTMLSREAREKNAARLLHQGIEVLAEEGRPDRAGEILARAHRFYGDTESGTQSGILLRELLILQGRKDETGGLAGLQATPDTTCIPPAVYRSLVDHYLDRSNLMDLERLLRVWGPAYGRIGETAELHLALVEAFLRAGKVELAESHLQRIPDDDPLRARGLLLLARSYESDGDASKALELYRSAAQLAPGPYQTRAVARSADLEFQSGRVTAALQGYSRLLLSDPPSDELPWGEYQLGNCNLLLGDESSARRHYQRVMENWPGSFWAPFARERLEELTWRAGLTGQAAEQGGSR